MSSNFVQRLRTWSSKQIFIVFAAFLVYILADGTTFSFGLYVDELINEYSKSNSNIVLRISVIAALTQSIPLLLSPLVCWLTTKFGASMASLIGCILAATGYFLPYITQFTKTFWIPAAGYGCLLSVGLSFCYVPAYLTLPFYFKDDLGLATGLAVSGSGVGQVALAIIVKACIVEYGWRGASMITGSLILCMLISVFAFRQPAPTVNSTSTSSPPPPPPLPITDLTENPTVPTIVTTANEEHSREEEVSMEYSHSRRSRRMTIAQVLPLLISSVPVRSAVTVTIPVLEPSTVRRHSFSQRTRTRTISTDPSSIPLVNTTQFQRARANTIAVPLQTMRKFNKSLERIQQPIYLPPLAPIASTEENINEEEEEEEEEEDVEKLSSAQQQQQIETLEESLSEKHWLLNRRFILFCFSNFALCLVLGVPYVIIPTYISETFLNQGFLSSWTLSSFGIASAFGQILLGYLHDQKIFSAWVMYTLAVIISGVSLIILALFRYKIIILICAFLYGLAISANYALQMLIVIEALSMDNMANAFGILQFCQGVSTLIGIPVQGLLRDLSHTYKLSFLTSGFIIILSGIIMFLWPCFKSMNKKKINNNIDNEE